MARPEIEWVLERGSIAQLRALYSDRRLSVEEAVGWYLSRIDTISASGPAINAVRDVSALALQDARQADQELVSGRECGPLHGIPMLLKDNILSANGLRASAGAAALSGFKPDRDALVVQRLCQAGAIILGKTNLTEFSDYVSNVMPSGFSAAGGVVRNPHGIEYGRGQGSSVGSAAAVAASLAMFAIGSETQNSIQTPAAYSSVVGYKPTVGLLSCAGIFPLVPSQDTPGPLARSVEDAALVAAIMAGKRGRDLLPDRLPSLIGVRIGVPRSRIADCQKFEHLMPLFENCISRLAKAGATLVDPCDLPSAEKLQDVCSSVFRTEFKTALNRFLKENGSPCGIGSLRDLIAWNQMHPESIPYGQSLLLAAEDSAGLDDAAYRADRENDIRLARQLGIDAALLSNDVHILIAPMGAAAKCTGKAGAPVVAIPTGIDATGTPFGISLFASVGSDARLLAIAAAVERVIGARQLPVFPSDNSPQ